MRTFTLVSSLALLSLVEWDLIHGQTVLCPNGKTRGLMCYTLYQSNLNWTDAEANCTVSGGHLMSITDGATHDLIVTYMDDEGVSDIWVGGEEYRDSWSWVSDDTEISPQGCWVDNTDPEKRDLKQKMDINVDLVTPDLCVEHCRNNSYKYAGVQLNDRGEQACYCGDTYGKYTKTDGCTKLCKPKTADNEPLYCGSYDANFVYLIDGAYGSWTYNQPNSWGGYQYCGAMDPQIQKYKFADETCTRKYYYICDIASNSSCTANNVGYSLINGQCVYISSNTESTWFDARVNCGVKGGDLVNINSAEKHDGIKLKIERTGSKHWIGLVSHRWRWTDGSPMKTYYNFASNKPSSNVYKCMHVSQGLGFKWSDSQCDATKNFVCQIDFATTTAAPTTTLPPTTVTTVQPTIAQTTQTDGGQTSTGSTNGSVNGTIGIGEPGIGASTQGSGLSAFQIALICLLIVLIIVIIICTIVFVVYKKKYGNHGRVEPQRSYDARSAAPVANGGTHTDPYLENGDPGSGY